MECKCFFFFVLCCKNCLLQQKQFFVVQSADRRNIDLCYYKMNRTTSLFLCVFKYLLFLSLLLVSQRGRLIIDHTARSGSLSIHDWTDDEIEAWNELAKSPNSFYKLRIKTNDNNDNNDNNDDNSLIASVLTCQLKRGDERIILHSDSDGHLIGFDYYTTNSLCSDISSSTKSKGLKKKKKFLSDGLPKSLEKSVVVSMSFGDKGESPFSPEYELSPPKKDQPSFWSKYWWIILIVGFVFIQSLGAASGAA